MDSFNMCPFEQLNEVKFIFVEPLQNRHSNVIEYYKFHLCLNIFHNVTSENLLSQYLHQYGFSWFNSCLQEEMLHQLFYQIAEPEIVVSTN